MVGKSIDSLKVSHEEVINAMALQMAALNMDLTIIKLENQKLKELLSEYVNSLSENVNNLDKK
jgi:hypothetical protein